MERRSILACICGFALAAPAARANVMSSKLSLTDIPLSAHEAAMREAINLARMNVVYPFAAVITKASTMQIVARGLNAAGSNPTLHGEIACINDYVARHGNKGWDEMILYTTGEPCSMCMSALVWSGIGGVVFGSSSAIYGQAGMDNIMISAKDVIAASEVWRPALLGGVLSAECDAMFMGRKRS